MANNLYITYRCRSLRFLLDFFTATGLTPVSFGRLTANPHSTTVILQRQLKNDDMKVSRAKQIVSTVGYKLEIELKEKEAAAVEILNYVLILPKQLREQLDAISLNKNGNDKNLGFLREFLSRNGISLRKLAKDIGSSDGTIIQWFKTDDMAISYLFKIKNALGVDVIFTIKEKEEGQVN